MKTFILTVFVVIISTVFTDAETLPNVALRRPAEQSSTKDGGVPERAVDGNRASDFGQGSCTHTESQKGGWWEVDLGATYDVKTVTITNRGDCCGKKLKKFYILVTADRIVNMGGKLTVNNICFVQKDAVGGGETRPFNCPEGRRGRFVSLILKKKGELVLCEVEVYGAKVNENNIALNRPVGQSSTIAGGVAERAVDGNRDYNYRQGSCSRSSTEKAVWWEVDLGANYDVKTVTITNRGDSFLKEIGKHLNNFYILATADKLTKMAGKLTANNICFVQTDALGNGETRSFKCPEGRRGRYVSLIRKTEGSLTLCEVEVYGAKL